MPKVYFGRKGEPGFDLELAPDLIAVRTRSGRPVTRSAGPAHARFGAARRRSACTGVP
ncbi:MAG: hypothetical protein U1F67_25225 [Rubrivivax sp.]